MGMIYKGLTFDGVNSLDYGIYITGEGVYNAPTRDVEMITIAGRNGEYALDKGRFNNISITYNAGTFGQDQTDFAEKISDFRNAILSRVGYKRLEDDYHTDEYRMAVYMDGLEVDPVHYSEAGEFELTFNCKPQRFLKSGETEQTIASGGTITNPTPFESQPLLEVEGYGNINIDDDIISIENVPYGKILLANKTARKDNVGMATESTLNSGNVSIMNAGDLIQVEAESTMFGGISYPSTGTYNPYNSFTATVTGGDISATATVTNAEEGYYSVVLGGFNYSKGTQSTHSVEVSISFSITINGSVINWSGVVTYEFSYEISANSSKIRYVYTVSPSFPSGFSNGIQTNSFISSVYGYSTKTSTGTEYIDLDLGEAYILESGKPVSINNIVSIPARLPELKAGANTITYDNTITSLKITPRWWKI